MNNMDMLEWINGLDTGFLEEAEAPRIRVRKNRKKTAAVIFAAAAAAVAMTVGVSAYLNYNRKMVQLGFGTLGEAMLTELVTPQSLTAGNGSMNAQMECLLCDGTQAMLLLTLTPADSSAAYDWSVYDGCVTDALHCSFRIGDTVYCNPVLYDPMEKYLAEQNSAGERWLRLYYELPDGVPEAALQTAELVLDGEGFDGIAFPADLTANTQAVTMKAKSGRTLTLSAFELYEAGTWYQHDDFWNLYVTWTNGETQRITYGDIAGSHANAGEPAVSWCNFDIPVGTEIQNTVGSYQKSGCEDWCGFLDVGQVVSIRVGDTEFYQMER